MLAFNITGTILIFVVFAIEIVLILQEKPAKDVVRDLKSNFILGMLILLTGLFMKGVELSVFSFMYSMALFKPATTWWLWVIGILKLIFYCGKKKLPATWISGPWKGNIFLFMSMPVK